MMASPAPTTAGPAPAADRIQMKKHTIRIARWLHRLFEASLLVKGILASLESAAGLGLLLTSNALIQRFVDWLTHYEIVEDPTDRMASAARHYAEAFSIQSQHFYALYLLSHGALKLGMVIALAVGAMWAYPGAIVILAGFVAYQMYTWAEGGSAVLLALSAFDLFMIWLVWQEYQARRASTPARPRHLPRY